MTSRLRLKRLETLLALRRAAAERAHLAFAQSIAQSAQAAERVSRVRYLIAAIAPGSGTAAQMKAAAQLAAMLHEAEAAAQSSLAHSVAQRAEAERLLAAASARAERLAARTDSERRALRRLEESRADRANGFPRNRRLA